MFSIKMKKYVQSISQKKIPGPTKKLSLNRLVSIFSFKLIRLEPNDCDDGVEGINFYSPMYLHRPKYIVSFTNIVQLSHKRA